MAMRSQFSVINAILLAVMASNIFQALAQSSAPAPAPGPASDGSSIDLVIAYTLMMVALVLTYLIHPSDAFSGSFF